MDLEYVRNIVVVINTVGLAVVMFMVWLRKPGEDAGKAVGELRQDLTVQHHHLSMRLGQLEERIEHMPDSKELAMLEGAVKKIDAQNAAQSERLSSMASQLNRIESYLLNRS